MSGTKREVAVYAPDGTEVTYRTAAGWTIGGIVQRLDGSWEHIGHGHSPDSVRKRTLTWYNGRPGYKDFATSQIWEATAPIVREYFGSHRVVIHSTFSPAEGWVELQHTVNASRKMIRRFSLSGVTALSLVSHALGRTADFQMDELLKSMRLPKQKTCATVGHGGRVATQRIRYNYRGEDSRTTEFVCGSCAKSYARRPVLVNFEALPLARLVQS